MNYPVTVTRDDIRLGVPYSCAFCALSLAILRAVHPDFVGAEVTGSPVVLTDTAGFKRHAAMPAPAHAFAVRFDGGLPVEPFRFELTLLPAA